MNYIQKLVVLALAAHYLIFFIYLYTSVNQFSLGNSYNPFIRKLEKPLVSSYLCGLYPNPVPYV